MRRITLLIGLFFWIATLAAQDPFRLKVDVDVVSLDVTVTDAGNELVSQLSQEDFQLYEDGVLQTIQFFSSVSAPNNILLLFDRSESTRGNRDFMQKVVARLLGTLRTQDSFSLASFDDEFKVGLKWSTDRTKAEAALTEMMRPHESHETHLYAALDRSLRQEFRGVVGRRAVIVLTDGQDTPLAYGSISDLSKALDASRQQRIPIHVVVLPEEKTGSYVLPNTRTYLDTVQSNLQRLADASGGQVLAAKQLEDVERLYEQIGRSLGNSYSLGYAAPRNKPDGKLHRIEVKTRDGSLRVLQSRTSYTW